MAYFSPQHSSSLGGSHSSSPKPRHLVVAIDMSEASCKAMQYAAVEVARRGDVLHLVHVARVLTPQCTIQHSKSDPGPPKPEVGQPHTTHHTTPQVTPK